MFTFFGNTVLLLLFIKNRQNLDYTLGVYFISHKNDTYIFQWKFLWDFLLKFYFQENDIYSQAKIILAWWDLNLKIDTFYPLWSLWHKWYSEAEKWLHIIKINIQWNIQKFNPISWSLDSHNTLSAEVKKINIEYSDIFSLFWLYKEIPLYLPFEKVIAYKAGCVMYPSNLSAFFRENPVVTSWIDSNPEIARKKSVWELFERYSCSILPGDINHLDIGLVSSNMVQEVQKYTWVNIKTHVGTKSTLIHMKEKRIGLEKVKNINVPSSVVFYMNDTKWNNIFRWNSNGVAVHINAEKAFEWAYLELLERDSIACVHLYRITLPEITQFEASSNLSPYLDEAKHKGFKIRFFDATLDKKVFVVLCCAENIAGGFPKYVFWSSANINLELAMTKSIQEALFASVSLITKKQIYLNYFQSRNNVAVSNTLDHLYFYANPENAHEIKYLLTENQSIPMLELMKKTEKNLWDLVTSHNDNILYFDTTTHIMSSLWLFWVKVFSEKFIPFWFGRNAFPIKKLPLRLNLLSPFLDSKNLVYNPRRIKLDDEMLYLHFLG